jgi:hypothetical protein
VQFLCDWKDASRHSGTCDAGGCELHMENVGRNKHLCRTHQKAYAAWKLRHPPAQPGLFQEMT